MAEINEKEIDQTIESYGGIEYWLEEEGASLLEAGSKEGRYGSEVFLRDGSLMMRASAEIIKLRKDLETIKKQFPDFERSHGSMCQLCGEPCDGFAANPGKWPTLVNHNMYAHLRCVSRKLDVDYAGDGNS